MVHVRQGKGRRPDRSARTGDRKDDAIISGRTQDQDRPRARRGRLPLPLTTGQRAHDDVSSSPGGQHVSAQGRAKRQGDLAAQLETQRGNQLAARRSIHRRRPKTPGARRSCHNPKVCGSPGTARFEKRRQPSFDREQAKKASKMSCHSALLARTHWRRNNSSQTVITHRAVPRSKPMVMESISAWDHENRNPWKGVEPTLAQSIQPPMNSAASSPT